MGQYPDVLMKLNTFMLHYLNTSACQVETFVALLPIYASQIERKSFDIVDMELSKTECWTIKIKRIISNLPSDMHT